MAGHHSYCSVFLPISFLYEVSEDYYMVIVINIKGQHGKILRIFNSTLAYSVYTKKTTGGVWREAGPPVPPPKPGRVCLSVSRGVCMW